MKHNKKRLKSALAVGVLSCAAGLSVNANAQIAGHNVILVHGFQFSDLSSKPSDAEVYNRKLIPQFWQDRAEARMGWGSDGRIEGHISEQVFKQAKDISRSGLCNNGCVIVTHSTGDLVTRYFLDNQESWLRNAGLQPLKITAVLDFAGAGGGTESASLAVDIISNKWVPSWIKSAVGSAFGLDISSADYSDLGVVQDLAVSQARSLAMAPNNIPHIRMSGSGGNAIMHMILAGADDGTVPAHSSCGSASPAGIDSCSKNISYSGKVGSTNGPSALLYNHFPILMSKNADHGEVIKDTAKGDVTYVLNNFTAGLKVNFATTTKKVPWWQFWKETGTFKFVKNSSNRSMSSLVYSNLK